MTATIIPFPRNRPLEMEELPDYWPQHLKTHYVHCTYDGWKTHEEMFDYCDAVAKVKRRPGESESDFGLRRAFVGISKMPPRG